MSRETPSAEFLPGQNPPFVYRLLHPLHQRRHTHRLTTALASPPYPAQLGFEAAIEANACEGPTWPARSL